MKYLGIRFDVRKKLSKSARQINAQYKRGSLLGESSLKIHATLWNWYENSCSLSDGILIITFLLKLLLSASNASEVDNYFLENQETEEGIVKLFYLDLSCPHGDHMSQKLIAQISLHIMNSFSSFFDGHLAGRHAANSIKLVLENHHVNDEDKWYDVHDRPPPEDVVCAFNDVSSLSAPVPECKN